MARTKGETPAWRKELQEVRTDLTELVTSFRSELKTDIQRLAIEMDRRFALVATKESVDGLSTKFDRLLASLESRLPPQAP